jgi:two-component system, NtrC family, nitrogen regulation sensor histidine kinase NtrY
MSFISGILRFKREAYFSLAIVFVFSFLMYVQTHLPFFKKFLPVGENKPVIVILNINLLLILLLMFLLIRILIKSTIEKRMGMWGSGLKTKLILTMLSVSVISSFGLFVLATWFYYGAMDRWFSEQIETAIDSAMELSDFYYQDTFDRYERIGQSLAAEIGEKGLMAKNRQLTAIVRGRGANHSLGYLSVHDPEGKALVTYSTLPEQIKGKLTQQIGPIVRAKRTRQIIPLRHGEAIIIGAVIKDQQGNPAGLLFLGDSIRVKGTQGIKQITSTYEQFKKARSLKKVVKYGFTIPLFLVTILSVFLAVWVGIKMSNEITVPLERVREGASIIAKGRFDVNLEDMGKDEIGTLVAAFNRMARELKITKDKIEEGRRYMEVILDNVGTGIISTDEKGTILLLNRAAKKILAMGDDDWIGKPLRTIVGEDFKSIIRSFIAEMKDEGEGSVVKELRLNIHNQAIYTRISLTTLRDESGGKTGYIATFDDITHIITAEKLATWREIAKKLTHEIKNPLTPIRLSAERIRRRLLPHSDGKEKEVLDETTSIIISASEDIKGIVNELTKLTHTSPVLSVEDVNEIVHEVIGSYKNLYQNIAFWADTSEVPRFRMSRDDIRRAIINLVTNAIKAIDSRQGAITATTRYDRELGIAFVEIADTGPGIPDEDKTRVFDPYFSKSTDGLGLGLAIVQSVVLEHNGRIYIEDNVPQGVRMIMELPVVVAEA